MKLTFHIRLRIVVVMRWRLVSPRHTEHPLYLHLDFNTHNTRVECDLVCFTSVFSRLVKFLIAKDVSTAIAKRDIGSRTT